MKILLSVVTALALFGSAPVGAQKDNSLSCLKITADIRLPGRTTRYDYQSIDEQRRLLFIAHLGDNAVTVFDLKSQKVTKNITGIPSPHGILAVPEAGEVFVSATGADKVFVIEEKSLKVAGRVDAGHFPDGIGYDPGTNRIFVSDEFGKAVSVIDVSGLRPVHKIEIGGVVGNTHYDPVSGRIFTTDESANELVEINPSTMAITSRIKLPGCEGAHGFAIGKEPHEAYVTGEDNASLVVVDLANSRVTQRFSVGREPDVLAIDSELHLLYLSSESGVVGMFRISKHGLSELCHGKLWAHAHTVSVDRVTHKVYFPLQDRNGVPDLRIMTPNLH